MTHYLDLILHLGYKCESSLEGYKGVCLQNIRKFVVWLVGGYNIKILIGWFYNVMIWWFC